MDDNKDLTIGADGLIDEGENKVEKADTPDETVNNSQITPEASVNKIVPPPEISPEVQNKEEVVPNHEASESIKNASVDEENALDQEESQDQMVVEQQVANEDSVQKVVIQNKDTSIQGSFSPIGTPESHEAAATAMSAAQSKPKKAGENRNNKKLAAIVTLVVAMALAGGAIYVYISTQNTAVEASFRTNSQA